MSRPKAAHLSVHKHGSPFSPQPMSRRAALIEETWRGCKDLLRRSSPASGRAATDSAATIVMAVLVTAIHAVPLHPVWERGRNVSAWMAVTCTAMTRPRNRLMLYCVQPLMPVFTDVVAVPPSVATVVMAVLVTAIHAVPLHLVRERGRNVAAWMAVTGTAMTRRCGTPAYRRVMAAMVAATFATFALLYFVQPLHGRLCRAAERRQPSSWPCLSRPSTRCRCTQFGNEPAMSRRGWP